jgi:hypothetical protein
VSSFSTEKATEVGLTLGAAGMAGGAAGTAGGAAAAGGAGVSTLAWDARAADGHQLDPSAKLILEICAGWSFRVEPSGRWTVMTEPMSTTMPRSRPPSTV